MELFKGRRLIIATKHHKERVIAPILEKELSVSCFTDSSFDTDLLGSFSGEVKRESDALTTAKKKCLMAMEHNQCDLGIASEGSFGQHPSLFFVSADDEYLILIDKKNDLEIIVRELSTATNFNARSIRSLDALFEFAELIQFPSHALILKPSKDSNVDMIKGIENYDQLKTGFHKIMNSHGTVYAETDMRAMYNPSRMAVIKTATHKLIAKLKSTCPQCQTPGFDIAETKAGLPCDACGLPTSSVKLLIFQCLKCGYKDSRPPSHGKTFEDPMYCNFCNP
jgi:Zn finger protein HypA/HybF involved in hydrogenase expression